MDKIICFVISLLPSQIIKRFFFNLCGFKVYNSKIGFFVIFEKKSIKIINSTIKSFNIISSDYIDINTSKISNFNYFKNINELIITDTNIGKLNKFNANAKNKSKKSTLKISNSFIGKNNYFDLSTDIFIEKSKIQNHCQLWTHEFDTLRKIKFGKISISNNTLIHNNVIVLPDVEIANKINIYPESVVHKSLNVSGNYKSVLVSK